ncbi:hypothetical protein SAMN06298216_2533 [Spirosomataceae bacterium TFI 002]|nr:hypothetical protein SAMN06298216_2533 [Spirosomataceae bacterium TFI 002]
MTTKLEQNLAHGYEVKIGEYLSKGFDIFKANAGGYIGYTVLYMILSSIINLIPFLNLFASILISPCLVFGFHLVSKSIHVDKVVPPFGEFFRGFDHFSKLILIALLSFLGYFIVALPIIITIGVSAFTLQDANAKEIFDTLIGGPFFVVVLTICGFIYLGVSWFFASLLAVYHNMSAWEALETSRKLITRNWFMMFVFLLLVGIIAVSGVILFIIGLVVTVPIALCYVFAAFEDIVGIPGNDVTDYNIEGIGEGLS